MNSNQKEIHVYDFSIPNLVFRDLQGLERKGEIEFKFIRGNTILVTNKGLTIEAFEDKVSYLQCELIKKNLMKGNMNYTEKSILLRRKLSKLDIPTIQLVMASLVGQREETLKADLVVSGLSALNFIIAYISVILSMFVAFVMPLINKVDEYKNLSDDLNQSDTAASLTTIHNGFIELLNQLSDYMDRFALLFFTVITIAAIIVSYLFYKNYSKNKLVTEKLIVKISDEVLKTK